MTKHILNEHFDNIYVLHINQRELDKIQPKINKKKINVQYFKGYNGHAKKLEFDHYLRIHRPRKRRNPAIKLLTPGAFGHIKSMINILSDAIKKKYKKILIFEYDIYFCEDFEERYKKYINKTYKILYLGAYQHNFFWTGNMALDRKKIRNTNGKWILSSI